MKKSAYLILFISFFIFMAANAAPKRATIPFLTMDQIARLEFTQRVKYIKELRKAAVQIENIQIDFEKADYKNAGLESAEKSRDLYALILGNFAEAAVDDCTKKADRKIGCSCIAVFYNSTYAGNATESEERAPFSCQFVKCNGANGAGGLCDYTLSGLPTSDPRSCIPKSARYNGTQECRNLTLKLSIENAQKIKNIIAETDKYFKFGKKANGVEAGIINLTDLSTPEAASILRALAENAYDPGAWAELVKLLSLYKIAKIDLPFDKLTLTERDAESVKKLFAQIEPESFAGNLDAFQKTAKKIFKEHLEHCALPMDASAIANVEKQNPEAIAKKYAYGPGVLATRQSVALRKLQADAKTGKAVLYTNGTVLETVECQAVDDRHRNVVDKFTEIVGSYPDFGNVAKPVPPIMPEPSKDYVVQPTGCSSNVAGYETIHPHGIQLSTQENNAYQLAARCASCVADRDMYKANQKDYSVSPKWITLLSSMATACGDAMTGSSSVNFAQMAKYLRTYGHCDRDVYDWSGPVTADEAKALNEIQTRPLCATDKDGKDNPKDSKLIAQFDSIYGISYGTAMDIFCPSDRLTKKSSNSKCLANPTTRNAISTEANRTRYKLEVAKFLKKDVKPETPSEKIYQCLEMAEQNARIVEKHSCFKPVRFLDNTAFKNDSNFRAIYNSMVNDIKNNGGTTVIWDTGNCYVAKQIETLTTKENGKKECISFIYPTWEPDGSTNGTSPYSKIACLGDKNDLEFQNAGKPDLIAKTPNDDHADKGAGVNNKVPSLDNISSYQFLAPATDCEGFSKGASNTGAGVK